MAAIASPSRSEELGALQQREKSAPRDHGEVPFGCHPMGCHPIFPDERRWPAAVREDQDPPALGVFSWTQHEPSNLRSASPRNCGPAEKGKLTGRLRQQSLKPLVPPGHFGPPSTVEATDHREKNRCDHGRDIALDHGDQVREAGFAREGKAALGAGDLCVELRKIRRFGDVRHDFSLCFTRRRARTLEP
jgi:hypothetical protein